MDGILRCAKYSFGPNRLHLCGPEANSEILAYIQQGVQDPGLERLLKLFNPLYPYLRLIAQANQIPDHFDARVVEAYWIGNELLDNLPGKTLLRNLVEEQKLKKRMPRSRFEEMIAMLRQGALPHHSFHVLTIWPRVGEFERSGAVERMDNCRISWGQVQEVNGPKITVQYQPLVLIKNKLALGEVVMKKVSRSLETSDEIETLQKGDVVTMHWNTPCEKITPQQATRLKKYTLRHLRLANQTL